MSISKLKQIENYPTGDCMRSVFACLLGLESVQEIPNFMRDGNSNFQTYIEQWLSENSLEWVEISYKEWCETPFFPLGYCGISGKSPRGDYDHIVVGEIKKRVGKNGLAYRDIYFRHDTSPFHDGNYIDGDVKLIGFLLRKL